MDSSSPGVHCGNPPSTDCRESDGTDLLMYRVLLDGSFMSAVT